MRKTEIILTIIFLLGIVYRILHWTGSGIFFVTASSALSILYLLFSWYFFKDKVTKKQNIVISIITGIMLSIGMTGILFKLQIWQGAKGLLTIGTFGILIMWVIVFIKRNKLSDMTSYYKNMFARMTLIGSITIILYFLPTGQLFKIYHPDDPEYARLFTMAHDTPENAEYQKAFEEYHNKKYGNTNDEERKHLNMNNVKMDTIDVQDPSTLEWSKKIVEHTDATKQQEISSEKNKNIEQIDTVDIQDTKTHQWSRKIFKHTK